MHAPSHFAFAQPACAPAAATPVWLRRRVLMCCLAALVGTTAACGSDAASVDATQDVSTDATTSDGGNDTTPTDAEGSDGTGDAVDAGTAPAPRTWVFRAIGGVSMGAASVNLALQHPDYFDAAGGLGGYIDVRYMVAAGLRLQLAGFCSLKSLQQAMTDGIDLNDATKAPLCGPATPLYELEFAQDFNHLHFDDNGATFDRRFYRRVFQNLTMAFGNFTTGENPDSAYLPAGVDAADHYARSPSARCAAALPVPATQAYNAEYNPMGTYAVIPFCDQDRSSDKTFPESQFDPNTKSNQPWDILLAVDLNGNGKRDIAEPVFLNARERFEDVGVDGCPSVREDGQGGCLAKGAPAAKGDPNGDDFHWWDNAGGTEGNDWHDVDATDPSIAEPYDDFGLDGVAGTKDEGEADGVYSVSKAFQRARDVSAATAIALLKADKLKDLDLFLDSGIRDGLHAGVSTRRVVAALKARGEDVRFYKDHAGKPGSLLPSLQNAEILDKGFTADYSTATLGKHIYVEYGKTNPSPADLKAGDGKHVGTTQQALHRIMTFMAWAITRFPDPDSAPTPSASLGISDSRHIYSPALKARRNFVVALPPGYDDPANKDRRYPVLHFLHGLGMSVTDLAPAGLILTSKMADGDMPKAIVVFANGECCEVHKKTGAHHCACVEDPAKKGFLRCIEPTCTGDEPSCKILSVNKSDLDPECHSGSLFYNMHSDKWGKSRDDMRYADSVMDVVKAVDGLYRTRAPKLVK